MNWTIRKYAVHLQMDGPFTNGLKWQLDCIKSLLYNKGSTIAAAYYRRLLSSPVIVTYCCRLSLSPIAVVYYNRLLPSPISVVYCCCLPIRAIAHW